MIADSSSMGIAPPAPPLPWYTVWFKALTEPKVATYERLVAGPGVTLVKACLWVGLVAVVATLISFGILFVLGGSSYLDPSLQQASSSLDFLTGSALLLVCLAPLAGVFAVVALLISAGISHLLARALGGTGAFDQLAYAFAAYSAPGSLVSSAISFIPCLGLLLGIPFAFYLLFLNILAIKAVHHLSWGRAVISSTAFLGFALVVMACGAIVILALLGPAIGNVFSNIVGDI